MRPMSVISAAALLATCVSARAQEAFDLRGLRVGMTLSEFRKAEFPDGSKKRTRVVCSHDKDRKQQLGTSNSFLDLGEKAREIGVTNCMFFSEFNKMTFPAGFEFAGVGERIATFGFAPGSMSDDGQARLYSIDIRMPTRDFGGVAAAIRGKYGEPSDHKEETLTNGFGARFPNIREAWANAASAIVLRKLDGSTDTMSVSYYDTGLLSKVTAAFDAAQRKGAKQL